MKKEILDKIMVDKWGECGLCGESKPIVPFRNDTDRKIERVTLDKFEGNIIVDKDGSVWFGRSRKSRDK